MVHLADRQAVLRRRRPSNRLRRSDISGRALKPSRRGDRCATYCAPIAARDTSFSPEDGERPFDSGLIAGKRALPFLEKKELRSKDLIRPRLRRLLSAMV